jgi:hypothetical protein
MAYRLPKLVISSLRYGQKNGTNTVGKIIDIQRKGKRRREIKYLPWKKF